MPANTAEAGNNRLVASTRDDGVLVVNGEAVFPIGIRIEGDGRYHQMIADAGFNMLLGSGAVKPSYCAQAGRAGLWVTGLCS